ncbi:IS66 family transposase [Shewanella inventionis]|nr:IS66 family transposase [Shewanella inventionis]
MQYDIELSRQIMSSWIDDGRLSIDNNRSNRTVKPFVICRNNWFFATRQMGSMPVARIKI